MFGKRAEIAEMTKSDREELDEVAAMSEVPGSEIQQIEAQHSAAARWPHGGGISTNLSSGSVVLCSSSNRCQVY